MLGGFLEVGPEEWEGLERLSEKEKEFLIGAPQGPRPEGRK